MLWRVRTTMADRPGSLAELARRWGEADVNILALQVFPQVGGVTDELVLRCPAALGGEAIARMVRAAGGEDVSVSPCDDSALLDAPTRHLHGVRDVLRGAEPVRVLADLVDAHAVARGDAPVTGMASWGGRLAGATVGLSRATPLTPTEEARADTFLRVVEELLAPGVGSAEGSAPGGRSATAGVADPAGDGSDRSGVVSVRLGGLRDAEAVLALHRRCSSAAVRRAHGGRGENGEVDLRAALTMLGGEGGALLATRARAVLGIAVLDGPADGVCEVRLLVDDDHRGEGIGTRLLAAATRRCGELGAEELLLRGPADSPAAVGLAFGSGLRARVRLHGDELRVGVPVPRRRGLDPQPR